MPGLAEATFKRKQQQAGEGAAAWAEYEAESRAVAEKTKRLRALRLGKEANEAIHTVPTEGRSRPVPRPRNSHVSHALIKA
jgi:hypothetical protein